MMNEDTIKGKWLELKGEILNHWGNMTDDELDRTQGNTASIMGLIQQKYGAKKEEIQEKLNDIMARFNTKAEGMKESLRRDRDMDFSSDRTLH